MERDFEAVYHRVEENHILNYVNLPFGISLFAVARKKGLQENE